MFDRSEVIDSLKELATADRESGRRSHCQLLNFYAEQLNFRNYEDLIRSLKAVPDDNIGTVSVRLMRQICAARLPSLDCSYCSFTAFNDGTFGYYSHWIGWDDKGREVRVPSPLDGMRIVEQSRERLSHPVYVIESFKELLAWQFKWLAGAVMPEALARKFFVSFFSQDWKVSKNPPMHKIRAQAARRRKEMDRLLSDPHAMTPGPRRRRRP
jgi:hypothetical protein